MKLVQFNFAKDGESIYIVKEKIVAVNPATGKDGGTFIAISGDSGIDVKGKPHEIAMFIAGHYEITNFKPAQGVH